MYEQLLIKPKIKNEKNTYRLYIDQFFVMNDINKMSSSSDKNEMNESVKAMEVEGDNSIILPPLKINNKTPLKNINTNSKLSNNEIEDYDRLMAMEKKLDEELAKLKAELETGTPIQNTMDNLHEYNDIKDATQVVLGAMATMHGVTIASLHREYDVPLNEND